MTKTKTVREIAIAPLCLALVTGLAAPLHAATLTPNNPAAAADLNRSRLKTLQELTDIPRIVGPTVTAGKAPKPPSVPAGGPTFLLHRVTFTASALLPKGAFEAVVQPFIGHRIGLAGLYRIVAAVDLLYERHGMPNARAFLPAQHVSGGTVRIRLVEGTLGKVAVAGNGYLPKSFILQRLTLPQKGKVLNVPELSKDIAIFNRLNDLQLRATLQPGAGFGQTDLTYSALVPRRNVLEVILDNWGLQNSGRFEASVLYRRRSLLTPDDSLTLYAVGNAGELSGDLSYGLPVNRMGGRLTFTLGDTYTKVLHGPYSALGLTGRSRFAAAKFAQPIYVDPHWLLSATAGLSQGETLSDQSAQVQTNLRSSKLSLGLDLSYLSPRISADATIAAAYGRSLDRVLNSTRSFDLISGTYLFQRKMSRDLAFAASGSWQKSWATVLPTDQLMNIGGPQSVRGYEANVLSGFSGLSGQFELHRAVSWFHRRTDAFAFLDAGLVSSPGAGVKTLSGIGLGATIPITQRVSLSVDLGVPLRRNVVPNQPPVTFDMRLIATVF